MKRVSTYRKLWDLMSTPKGAWYTLGGHFKTGHRGSLQNRPTRTSLSGLTCFTLSAGILASSTLSSVALRQRWPRGPNTASLLENLIPVVTFPRGKVILKSKIRPSRPCRNPRYSHVDHIYQHAPRFISIECRHDFAAHRQLGDGRLDQTRLF